MNDNNKQALSTASEEVVESRIIEEVLAADIGDAQRLIVHHLEALKPDQKGSEIELFLQSLWRHIEGLRVVSEEGDLELGTELQESAAAGFEQLGAKELESASRALSTYAKALMEVKRLNLNRSMELFDSTEKYLRDAGRFGRKFQGLIDHMKPGALFVGALPALATGDYDSARALASQASDMSKRVAEDYYETGTPQHFTFLGQAYLYEAVYSHVQAQADLSNLELDRIVSEDISASAREAERLLFQSGLKDVNIQSSYNLSKALVEISQVTKGIAVRMDLCFKAAFKPDLQGFLDLKARTHRAIHYASKVGPQAVPIIRSCEGLLTRIHNLERLARPRKTDFGIYSGLISSVLFACLLVISLWTRRTFGFELEDRTFFLTIVSLALIGGFGFGALRFKSLFFSRSQSEEAGAQQNSPKEQS